MQNKLVVILDGGHGWNTPGKRSTKLVNGRPVLRENELNDSIVNMLSFALFRAGIQSFIVSGESEDVSLTERCNRENKIYKEQHARGRHTIFISIHADAYTDPEANGNTVFYHPKSHEGKRLATVFSKNMKGMHIRTRGIKSANYKVLRSTLSPAILIECGFMTNNRDLSLLTNQQYRFEIVMRLLKSIQQEIKILDAEN